MRKLISVFIITFFIFGCDFLNHKVTMDQASKDAPAESVQSKVYYTCSMHPHIKEDKPGKCPICHMNLTKVTLEPEKEGEQGSASESIGTSTDSPAETIAKVRLRKSQLDHFHPAVFSATTMKMSKKLRVLGQVKSAEEKLSNIAARFPARVEKVYVESVGSQIRKGDPVVRVYSPELLTTGEELILSAQNAKKSEEFNQLYAKAREKLILWGIRPSQINKWVQDGKMPRAVTLYAGSSGVVRKRNAVSGKYFKEGQNYFELSDLSQVWVEMDVYEHDSNLVKLGQLVSLNFVAAPGKLKTGEIDFISPTIDDKTRTLKIRTTIANQESALKPGMLAQGIVNVNLEGLPLVIPTTAIIDTGNRKIAWLKTQGNKYEAKVVQTGFLSDGYAEVLSGIKEGDQVVIEGNFLLDAQAQFFGGYEDFNSQQKQNSKGHNH